MTVPSEKSERQARTDRVHEGFFPRPGLLRETADRFRQHFGRRPRWMVAAPGRVNLIGEHTDYNDGFVLPMAIERYVVIAADRPGDPREPSARFHSTEMDEEAVVPLQGALRPGPRAWARYVEGVVAGCLEAGLAPGGFDAVIHGDVPLGGGLSSSAALEVAVATLIETLAGRTLDPLAKALLCQKAEHTFAGMPCGIMDQFSSVMGRENALMLLDCRTHKAERVPFADPEVTVLIINSNVQHELTGTEYATRRVECTSAAEALGVGSLRDATMSRLQEAEGLDPVVFRRGRHVVGEIARTQAAAEALRRGDWPEMGRLMYASHVSLRDDYEVSCEELDVLVELARHLGPAAGVIGSRMTGGGFGGCTVSLVRTGAVAHVVETIEKQYRKKTGIAPMAFVTRPAAGAIVLKQPGHAWHASVPAKEMLQVYLEERAVAGPVTNKQN